MKKVLLFILCISLSWIAISAQSNKKVAIVKIMRGTASVLAPDGAKSNIKKGMWLKEGSIIKTGERSFVRLSFIDKSSMNVGPKSELKIEKFSKNEAGVINVLTGKIRSQVTKDYLNMEKGKSKLFVKSKSAVMGIRGTDFLFSTNKRTGATTAVLFEGSVVFNKINPRDNLRNLEAIVDKGRRINPGEFSVTHRRKARATVPSRMSSKQFSKLMKNNNFEVAAVKNIKKRKSVVPPGLKGEVVAGDSKNLKDGLKKVIKVNVKSKFAGADPDEAQVVATESKGFVKGEDVKPVDGSIVHIDTGTIIPLGVDSNFDKNAGEWVSNSIGGVDKNGEYLPPEGYKITDEGKLLKTDIKTGVVKEVVLDVKPLDQVRPLDDIKTVEYIAPKEVEKGPSPAGTVDSLDQVEEEFNKDPVMNPDAVREDEDGNIINPDGSKVMQDGTVLLPDGTTITPDGTIITPDGKKFKEPGQFAGQDNKGDGYLPPPPKPGDCSTCNQPNTIFNDGGPLPPPPPGKTNVRLKVNKK